jgi:hypothetical protein
MDEKAYEILSKLNLKHAKLIKTKDIETPEVVKIKKDRNKGEYSWTLKSVLMNYLFHKYKKLDHLFYLDGDIYFYDDIKLVYEDIGTKSIALAPHRFPRSMKGRTKRTGVFNAGVLYLKKDKTGLKALKRWKKQCIEWCYWRLEDGKLGDQMYLDEWPKLYKNIHQFSHKGINLAPWNVDEYKLSRRNGNIFVDDQPLIFYHFHQFKVFTDYSIQESHGYQISKDAKNIIYGPYVDAVLDTIKKVKNIDPKFNEGLDKKEAQSGFKNYFIKKLTPIYWKIKSLY